MMVNPSHPPPAHPQDVWKTSLIVHKFIKILKRKQSSSSIQKLNPNSGGNRLKVIRSGVHWKQRPITNNADHQNDPNSVENGRLSPFVFATSLTRQLAFANVDEELTRKANHSKAKFYSSAWANALAKISTVIVILVTVILIVLKMTKIMD